MANLQEMDAMAGEHMIDARQRAIAAGVSTPYPTADELMVEKLQTENRRLRYALEQIAVIDDLRDAHARASDALGKRG